MTDTTMAFFDEERAEHLAATLTERVIQQLKLLRMTEPKMTSAVIRPVLREAFGDAIQTYLRLPDVSPEPSAN